MMLETVIATAITALASVFCQIVISARTHSLVEYRVGRLEEKVDKLNTLYDRIIRLETTVL